MAGSPPSEPAGRGRTERAARRRPGRREGPAAEPEDRFYRRLENPFEPVRVFSDDQVETLHRAALELLRTTGMRVLHDEARKIYRAGGAEVDPASLIVRVDPAQVETLVRSAPGSFEITAGAPERSVRIGGRALAIAAVGGTPNVLDGDGKKRPGTLADFADFLRLAQSFDVIHLLNQSVEPQDVPLALRHLAVTRAQLTLSDKVPCIYSRGARQVADGFAIIRIARGLSEAEFARTPCCYTVINTNSPLVLDLPMAQGIIDFACAGQPSIITPFTLAGAMAPVTLAGALVQQHAEALMGIALAQLVRPGAPVVYGAFTSNVDMKSGAPAFGTPEAVKAALGSGQLARFVGLPWRSSNVNASNAADAQAAYEAQMSIWGATMGGCNVLMHGAGWMEGGLSASRAKFIIDVEMLQMVAELFRPVELSPEAIGLEAIAGTGPGGHFFGGDHTLARYRTAFYRPLLSDWRNFGQWSEVGGKDAATRAGEIAAATIAAFEPPMTKAGAQDALDDFCARRTREGGAPPDAA